ncbi:MAG: alpha/beta hydrolase [Chloroflexota bacterium]|nr:alpha/beta hydrolase [Chloroflexota bacterium]
MRVKKTSRWWIWIALFLVVMSILIACSNGSEQPTLEPLAATNPPPTKTASATVGSAMPEAVEEVRAATSAQWEEAECQFEAPRHLTVECGYLTVPEDRNQPAGPTIRLHAAIVHSEAENLEPDPVLYLSGGPGGPALDWIGYLAQSLGPVLRDRDLVVFDQRGVGYSEPSLDCPEVADLFYETLEQGLSREEEQAREREALLACRDRLVADDVNLAAYNSAASAADVEALRRALGYESWNLYGGSYGTRLALTTVRDYPEGVRSAILESTVPLEVDLYAVFAPNAQRAFDLLFARCAADEMCSTTFPDLERTFYELVEQLDAEPITVKVLDRSTYEMKEVSFNGDDLIELLFNSLYQADRIPYLPKLIYDLRQGNTIRLADWLEEEFPSRNVIISEGVFASVMCGEEALFSQWEPDGGTSSEKGGRVPALIDAWIATRLGVCETWGAGESDPIENEAVQSDIPVLILAGEFDPVTPPSGGQLVASTLSNAYFYEFPGLGHSMVSERKCAREMVDTFLDDPMSAPDATCLENLRAVFLKH